MSTEITKIGIIQTAPLPGDFSNNLRAVVNGYRECIEHGAELVIAPACSICGLEPGHLVLRRSFISQTKKCLNTLSKELGTVPLLLAAYTRTYDEDAASVGIVEDDNDYDSWGGKELDVLLTPFLVENGCITELEATESMTLGSQRFYIDTTEVDFMMEKDYDFIICLSELPWYTTAADDAHYLFDWATNDTGATLICCRPVGTAGSNLYGGGSCVYSPEGKMIMRMPYFETCAQVVDLKRPKPVLNPPEPAELLCSALQRGIRDTVRNNCFGGVCIPLDHKNSALLAALSVEALGSSMVCGITFSGNDTLAEKLGISCYKPNLDKMLEAATGTMGQEHEAALRERLCTTVAMTYAESRGLLLCSPIDHQEIMLGNFQTYGLSGGYLAPLGNLYTIDIFVCSCVMKETYPDIIGAIVPPSDDTTDRIIHELMDKNVAASAMLNPETNYLFKENKVRSVQRKILMSAMKRTQLPLTLNISPKASQHYFPVSHRLND